MHINNVVFLVRQKTIILSEQRQFFEEVILKRNE